MSRTGGQCSQILDMMLAVMGCGCAAKHRVLIPLANGGLRTSAHGALEHLKHDPPAPGSCSKMSAGGLAAVLRRKFYSMEPCKANMKHGF